MGLALSKLYVCFVVKELGGLFPIEIKEKLGDLCA
jgi:hypothetical protein